MFKSLRLVLTKGIVLVHVKHCIKGVFVRGVKYTVKAVLGYKSVSSF